MIKTRLVMNEDTSTIEEYKAYATLECNSEEAYNHLMELIAKDTPQEAEYTEEIGHVSVWCPSCEGLLGNDMPTDDLPEYCPHCGQCIK